MKIYKITYNIECLLPYPQNDRKQYFANLKTANEVFEILAQSMKYHMADWIQLEVLEVSVVDGEYYSEPGEILCLLSDNTKIGMNFNPDTYE